MLRSPSRGEASRRALADGPHGVHLPHHPGLHTTHTHKDASRGPWPAQSEEHAILGLRVMSVSPMLGAEMT